MNTEQLKQAAMAATPEQPARITAFSVQEIRTGKFAAVEIEVPAFLALLECVDALREWHE